VQDVSGSWTVPSVTCDSGTEYSSFWVGIDGFNSNTIEQMGTDADCHSGSPAYYAWFELYPHPMFAINTLPVNAGAVMSANVHYDPRSGGAPGQCGNSNGAFSRLMNARPAGRPGKRPPEERAMGTSIREAARTQELEPLSLSALIHQEIRVAIETAALGTTPYERSEIRRGYRNGT
jgi:Peptidase A4 family